MNALFLLLSLLPYHQLSWSDFHGRPKGPHAAMTHCGIVVHTVEVGDRVTAQWGVAYFDGEKSWTRTASPQALAHEQGHLDIARVYAGWLRLGMNSDSLIAVYQSQQVRYDVETRHGVDSVAQERWQQWLRSAVSAGEKP
jgi:hypothetical protein